MQTEQLAKEFNLDEETTKELVTFTLDMSRAKQVIK
jgi:hypothetical protein